MASTSETSKAQEIKKEDKRAQDASLVPVTYYPLDTQRQHAKTRQSIASKPYAHYFHDSPLYVRREALPAVPNPISNPKENVLPLSQISKLLEPGDQPVENGWYVYPDGTGYVTSKTQFPGCTADMIEWWFWWHSVEGERYALWYPYNHCDVKSTYAKLAKSKFTTEVKKDSKSGKAIPILERDDLPHRQRWLGSTHTVTEFIGPILMSLRIEFKDPSYFGLGTWEDLKKAGYETAVCGILWDKMLPMKVGDMIHLWRKTDDGLELKSRYYLGHQVYFDLFGLKISVDK